VEGQVVESPTNVLLGYNQAVVPMNFVGSPPFQVVTCIFCFSGVAVCIWILATDKSDGRPFSWPAIPFILWWTWAGVSAGGRLVRGDKPPEDGGPP
jgi:hypothetical protein